MIKPLHSRTPRPAQTLICAAVLLFLAACSRSSLELEKMNPSAVVDVATFGAKGDGVTDDTKALQDAIDKVAAGGGGTVVIPPGKYMINTDTSLKLRSRVHLVLADTNTHLVAIPNDTGRYYVVLIREVSDASITGGRIIGERYQHTGTTGEWGMGIGIYRGSRNIRISNIRVSDCWGDGVICAGTAALPCEYVTLKKVVSDNNRRQGLSIIGASNITVDSCQFLNTNGTAPSAGIDIEPDAGIARDISITNCTMAYNKGVGVLMYENSQSDIHNIEVHNNVIHNNSYGGYLVRPQHVRFNYNRIFSNKYGPPIYCKDTVDCIIQPNTYQ
jgi:polygalacturonase